MKQFREEHSKPRDLERVGKKKVVGGECAKQTNDERARVRGEPERIDGSQFR